ncbi:MAG: ATP-binding protein [Blastocatellales bacterium]|nr:ATP-binding protein [Blastocatellales bacterium]
MEQIQIQEPKLRPVADRQQTDGTPGASDSPRCHRKSEIEMILGALRNSASLLVVAGPGLGLSTLARFLRAELRARDEESILGEPTTVKAMLVDLCRQLGLNTEKRTGTQLQEMLAEAVPARRVIMLFDDAHRLPVSIRSWLESLHERGARIVLFATLPPRRDIFLRLPRIELKPLPHAAIREIMLEAARYVGREFTSAELSTLAERCGGNPMLARRVVREEHLGLDPTAPDHTEWIDGTPMLIAALLCFTVLRYLGRGLHSSDLYLVGGMLAVAVGIVRVLLYSLPRKSAKLGQ